MRALLRRVRRPLLGWRRIAVFAAAGALSGLTAAPALAATVDATASSSPATPSATPSAGTVPMAATTTTTSTATAPAPTATTAPADPCAPAPGTSVPAVVASVFRCRLTPQLGAAQAARVAAEAVVVAQCESEFDPAAVVFDGAYVHRPHPQTGMYYSATGLFQMIRSTADKVVDGGYAAATDPVANTEGAVRLYLQSRANGGRGWEDWECAAVNGAFRGASVLPGWPGGPASLPAWAYTV